MRVTMGNNQRLNKLKLRLLGEWLGFQWWLWRLLCEQRDHRRAQADENFLKAARALGSDGEIDVR